MTLGELYFRNGDMDMFDDVVLHIDGQVISGKLYQLSNYMGLGVVVAFDNHYLLYDDNKRSGFREFCRIYNFDTFDDYIIKVFDNGVFKGDIKVRCLMKDERFDDRRFSFRNNTVFLDNNLL